MASLLDDMTFTHSFDEYLLSPCFRLKAVLDARARTIRERDQILPSWSLHSPGRTCP